MRKLQLLLLLAVVAVLPALGAPLRGQAPIAPQILYARQRQIVIPFDADPKESHRLKQVQLYYSLDQGRNWQQGATSAPNDRKFPFTAGSDGYYLFAVQTTDTTGRVYPEKTANLVTLLRVIIDTVPPTVNLRGLPSRGSEVGVAWDIQDANLDLTSADSIRLEYRTPGSPNWVPLYRAPGSNQHYWNPGTSGLVEVKLRARDLAGNFAEANGQTSLSGPGNFNSNTFGSNQQGNALSVPLNPNRKFLRNTLVTLDFQVEQGPSGLSGIDLWITMDGRSWSKHNPRSPNALSSLQFDVPGEGVYGITLIPKSGVGISAPAPAIGEEPQLWIEVDVTKPVVRVERVEIGTGEFAGKLRISWEATDKNLTNTPISLKYSEKLDDISWLPLAGNLPNNGRYDFMMPTAQNMPWQFYVRVEAIDQAGNVGESTTHSKVKVDTIQPKIKSIDAKGGIR